MDKWLFSLIYEKLSEGDSDDCARTDVMTDSDFDYYYAAATYTAEDLSAVFWSATARTKPAPTSWPILPPLQTWMGLHPGHVQSLCNRCFRRFRRERGS